VDGRLLLRTSKTGVRVQLPLPPVVIETLETVASGRYFFWTGESKPKSAITAWQEKLARLCRSAKVEKQ
jgi:hypothetical protein